MSAAGDPAELAEVMVVEDDAVIRTLLEMALRADGFRHVVSAARGDEGLKEIRRRKPDAVLLDVMLPGLDGFAICAAVRADPALADTRIVMLTARTENADIIRGLDAGADDYVTKPFDRKVLLARVRAVLRRGGVRTAATAFDGLVLDETNRVATLNGTEVKLAPGEFKILALLAQHRGTVLTRTRIMSRVCDDDNGARDVTERTIDVQVANVRKKLGAWASHIETIRGIGYRIV